MSDLLDDLRAERVAPPPPPPDASTPSLAVRWTPVRWSRPRVSVPERGGLALHVGPLTVEVSRS